MASTLNQLEETLQEVAAKLRKNRHMVATVESCTGGWISQSMTSLAGSSEWFERGFVTYSNEAKQDLVGVQANTLEQHGAVSREVAHEMAKGGIEFSRADVVVAVTGIAGPDGGTSQKPVGTVWIAWADRTGGNFERHYQFQGDRNEVRFATVECALSGLIELIDSVRS